MNASMTSNDLTGRFADARKRIASAASQWGRSPESVQLVAISKGHPAQAIRTVAQLGQRDFGENYLQEVLPKLESLKDLPLVWHFTGQIQSNKTRPIAEHFAWVHTVDREKIAARLSEQRPPHLAPINVCIQVSLEEEAGKGGVPVVEAAALAAKVAVMPRLRLRGLMALPPPRRTFEEQKALFDRMTALLRELNGKGLELDTLSMGMSDDLEAAVAAGSTLVRIGTAIFGERSRG
jgi:pyridoxal phosphate enzyme (YggS family)